MLQEINTAFIQTLKAEIESDQIFQIVYANENIESHEPLFRLNEFPKRLVIQKISQIGEVLESKAYILESQ